MWLLCVPSVTERRRRDRTSPLMERTNDGPGPNAGATSSIEDQIRLRERKAAELRDRGAHPYGNGVAVPHTTGLVRARHGAQGAAALDYGKTAAGEHPNPALPGFRLLTKALRPLPEKWHGLTDVETRYRRRYVDLAVNPEVRETFRRRARMITALRRFLDERGYVEVETPILHKPEEAGGAAARPFATHHNALDLDLKMRIATELHLKRLIVGGPEAVYEVGRIFRNEGIDRRHNPEFTSVEFYQAYATHEDLMLLTEQMVQALALAATGRTRLPYQGGEIDYAAPWPRVSMVGEVARLLTPETADGPLSAQMEALSRLPDAVWASAALDPEAKKKLSHAHTLGARI